jgi:3-dehydroquinate synthase
MEESAVPVIAREQSALDYLIYRSVANKAEIVVEDEREAGMRALLNFGHSFGHALEAETAYQEFLHGEAVAIGMVTAARLSESRGLCARGSARRIAGLLERLGLATQIPAHTSMEGLARALNLDKKAVASGLRLILLESVGRAVIDDQSTDREILAAMQQSLAADAA